MAYSVEKIENLIKNGERTQGALAWKRMTEATVEGKRLCAIWKIPNKIYRDWYENWKKDNKERGYEPPTTTLDEETTYIVHTGQKAFDPSKGGYSIFAQSLGCLKRDNSHCECDRIEHYECEWAILIDPKEIEDNA